MCDEDREAVRILAACVAVGAILGALTAALRR